MGVSSSNTVEGAKKERMKRLQSLAIAGLIAIPAAVVGATLPSVEPAPKTLEARVLHELRMLPYYSVFDDLGFTVDGTEVTLTGEVTNPILKSDAENSVKHIEGVTRVKDRIEVLPLSDFDWRIRRQTYFAIYGYGPLQKYSMGTWPSIHIIVKNGDVKL